MYYRQCLLLIAVLCSHSLIMTAEETPLSTEATVPPATQAVTSITHHGITWTFDKAYPSGTYVNGDFWVQGPIVITKISNNLNEDRFTAGPGVNGSMLNPGTSGKQGYDNRLGSYKAELNAALIDGKPISSENPLHIEINSSLVSMVSWLYNSATDTEKGCPRFNGGTKAPRPVTRSGAILTIVENIPAAQSFRPPYCSNEKIELTLDDINTELLHNLDVVEHTPQAAKYAKRMRRPWIDHVHEYLGAMVHPSENLPNYGRDMCRIANDIALLLHLKIDPAEKQALLIPFVQWGIDLYGIAKAKGSWPANGGHHMGRKLPILAAGKLFQHAGMLAIGHSDTRFHDDEQTFFVSAKDIERTTSKKWNPDSRAKDKLPYTEDHIGMPEWGIRHFAKPYADNRGWRTPYRDINNAVIPGTVLAASLFDVRAEWNHDAIFDYARRIMQEPTVSLHKINSTNAPNHFSYQMWQAYADQFVKPIEWKPLWSASKAKAED